jgi:ubiquinone/menaquinone biosynthesis C-methylase UbiE
MAAANVIVNHWPSSKCAKAFWSQNELPPYKRLLRDTIAWCMPMPQDRWLDLGCGCGQLTGALWTKARGQVAQILGMDCAAVNATAYDRLRQRVTPSATARQIAFLHGNFSDGLSQFEAGSFDGVVSGLAIQYAESFDANRRIWTRDAYRQLLRDIARVLKPGGQFVFSVNRPDPAWRRVALASVPAVLRTWRMVRFVRDSFRMLRYGNWLSAESRKGRFHFLPVGEVIQSLREAGFSQIDQRLSYCGQAYVLRCRKNECKSREARGFAPGLQVALRPTARVRQGALKASTAREKVVVVP